MKKDVCADRSVLDPSAALPRLLARPPKSKKPPKSPDVWTCPMTMETIKNHKTENGKPQLVGNYRVHFCCAGCPETFAKLSASAKKEKALAAAKKDTKKEAPAKKA